jgi:hypothetical protein
VGVVSCQRNIALRYLASSGVHTTELTILDAFLMAQLGCDFETVGFLWSVLDFSRSRSSVGLGVQSVLEFSRSWSSVGLGVQSVLIEVWRIHVLVKFTCSKQERSRTSGRFLVSDFSRATGEFGHLYNFSSISQLLAEPKMGPDKETSA